MVVLAVLLLLLGTFEHLSLKSHDFVLELLDLILHLAKLVFVDLRGINDRLFALALARSVIGGWLYLLLALLLAILL